MYPRFYTNSGVTAPIEIGFDRAGTRSMVQEIGDCALATSQAPAGADSLAFGCCEGAIRFLMNTYMQARCSRFLPHAAITLLCVPVVCVRDAATPA